jgi:exodeoxyribonuclease VII large subunit
VTPEAHTAAAASPGRGILAPDAGPPGSSPGTALTITALNTAIKDTLEGMLPTVWVAGEVSQFRQHQNGHWYFSLKDAEGSVLECVVWGSDKARFPMAPEVGMQVFARGRLSVWVRQPRIQFRVTAIEDQGEGIWRRAFEKTRAALERDGLLDAARKRPIPRFPRTVGVITSPSGAAMHDIVSVVARRNRTIDIVVIPAAVQGDAAPASLVAALGRAARWGGADVLIVGRGGGSREDLWCFNDETVARAIAASPIPVISAVGHEVDVSIADFVADLRAATPSAAAELVAPVLDDMLADLRALGGAMRTALARRVRDGRREMATARVTLVRGAGRRVADAGRDLAVVQTEIRAGARKRATEARHTLVTMRRTMVERTGRTVERGAHRRALVAARLHALSPLATIARGYAVARTPAGTALTGASQFAPGAPFNLKLRDGDVDATTTAVRRTEPA